MKIYYSRGADEMVLLEMTATFFQAWLNLIKTLSRYNQDRFREGEVTDEKVAEFFNKTAAIIASGDNSVWYRLWDLIYNRDKIPIRAKDDRGKWDSMYLDIVSRDQIIDWLIFYLQKMKGDKHDKKSKK